eukprot:RCo050869
MLEKFLPAVAALCFFATWVVGIASTCMWEWWYFLSPNSGPHQGLWSSCWDSSCSSNFPYSSQCMALLNVCRAFSVMTIIFGFFATVTSFKLFKQQKDKMYFATVLVGFLTWSCSVIPWSVYLALMYQCLQPSQLKNGAGWFLAVCAFTLAVTA